MPNCNTPSTPDDTALNELYLKSFEASPDAAVIIGHDGKIAAANVRFELLFAYSRAELVGRDIEVLIPPTLRDTHIRHRDKYFCEPRLREMGTGSPNRIVGVNRHGMEFLVQIMLAPVVVLNAGVFVMAVVRRAADQVVPPEVK